MKIVSRPDWSIRISLVALLLMMAHAAAAVEIIGRVVGITDGDTLTVLSDLRQQTKVRLAEIDTPESGQPYGSRARQALSDLAFGKSVRVVEQGTDRYGRTVGRVYAGSVDVNAEMSARARPGSTGNTATTSHSCAWSRRRGRHAAACGRYPRRNARRLGNGGLPNAVGEVMLPRYPLSRLPKVRPSVDLPVAPSAIAAKWRVALRPGSI
jgi:hypothetical protein